MDRKALKISVCAVALFGIAMGSVPFVQSMWPNEKQIRRLPHIDISGMKNSSFIETNGTRYKAFILKNAKGELKVFSIPFWEGRYRMPDVTWWRAHLPCDSFGPEANGERLLENGKFKCFDRPKDEWEWWKTHLQWTFDGKSLDGYTEELLTPRYELRGTTIVLGKSK